MLFLLCDISIILTCATDIVSCYCISEFPKFSVGVSTLVTTFFFINLCVLPFVLCLYCYASISAVHKFSRFYHSAIITLFSVYFFMVIANTKTGWIFAYIPGTGYVRGPLKYSTFIITGIMIIFTEMAIFRHKRSLSTRMFTVFVFYPIISTFVSLIQVFKAEWLLSGCSGTITMILMYLAIQSDQIEIDYKSGLKTEQHLSRTLRKKIKPCVLSIISIENLGVLQEIFGTTEVDKLIFNLVRSFRVNIHGSFFRSGSKFIVLSNHNFLDRLEQEIKDSFLKYSAIHDGTGRAYRFEFVAASVVVPEYAGTYDEAMEILNELIVKARAEKSCC